MINFLKNYKKPILIAEIGCNHLGNILVAKKMISELKKNGINYVKFQKRNNRILLSKKEYNKPHPVPENSYGTTYGKHREYLEFNLKQHKELQSYCKKKSINYSSSVWDWKSTKEIISLKTSYIKVPSACNLDFKILKLLRDNYTGEIHLSFGMTTPLEEEKIIKFFEVNNSAKKRLIIYSCVSGYPVSPEDLSLLDILRLKNLFKHRVKSIGFSGHHNGISADIAAYTLGATHIERHFTLDRTWKGTDHSASLEIPGIRKLKRDLINVQKSLNFKKKGILSIEKTQRDKLKKIVK